MPRLAAFVLVLVSASFALAGLPDDEEIIQRRGDANSSGVVDSSDAVAISAWLFNGGDEPPCLNQADANGDGVVNVSDVSYLTAWLFQGGPEPPSPGPYATTCTATDPWIGCDVPPCS